MFEQMGADIAYLNRQRLLAIRSYYGPAYQPPASRIVPKDYRTPKGQKPATPRGRHPAHTRFKRLDVTVGRDAKARDMRALGYSYQEIADYGNYNSRQAAHAAVKRAQRDHLSQGKKKASSRIDKVPLTRKGAQSNASTDAISAPSPGSPETKKYGRARGKPFPPVTLSPRKRDMRYPVFTG
jgi:hypothetical protein